SKGMNIQTPRISISGLFDKKLVKLSKLIVAPASRCVELVETIVDITVLVNERPPKTYTIIFFMNNYVFSNRKNAVNNQTEKYVTSIFNTYKVPLLSTSIPPI